MKFIHISDLHFHSKENDNPEIVKTLLNNIEKTMNRAGTMTRKGVGPVVGFMDKVYEKGVILTKKKMDKYDERPDRSTELPKYDVRIGPQFG